MRVDGETAVLVHLAYPSAHLRTPQMFNARCAERGINAVVVPWQVRPEHLSATVENLRQAESVAGALVTVPHKEAAAHLCDRLEGTAEILNVVNVIRRDRDGRLTGRILDGDGFVGGLKAHGFDPAGRSALIVGAGGVAHAIAAGLIDAGIACIRIANRTPAKSVAMIGRLNVFARARNRAVDLATSSPDPTGMDLLVNATVLGMREGDGPVVHAETITSGMTVAEVVMVPETTPLLAAAIRRGAHVIPGSAMLVGQIDPFIDFVLGVRPPAAIPSHVGPRG